MLVVDLKVGETVRIGKATVTLEDKSGRNARLVIDASKDIPIERVKKNTILDFAKGGMHKDA